MRMSAKSGEHVTEPLSLETPFRQQLMFLLKHLIIDCSGSCQHDGEGAAELC